MENKSCLVNFRPVYPDEVIKIISDLNNSSSFGLDEIHTYIVKLLKNELTPALTHIVNLALVKRTFPESWKTSKIIPLHKKDDVLNPNNYRPVAILPILSKILERAVFNQMIEY